MATAESILKEFITKYNGKQFAGYFNTESEKTTFHYYISDNSRLPAAAYVLDYLKGNRKTAIYSNIEKNHWIRTYFNNVLAIPNEASLNDVRSLEAFKNELKRSNPELKSNQINSQLKPIKPFKEQLLEKLAGDTIDTNLLPNLKLTLNAGFIGSAPPLPEGGLFAAAQNIGSASSGKAKGLERALRYYMLATYSLLALEQFIGYQGGNYVAAILVSDQGQILSFGINNGIAAASFHHAEVNMLLSYFQRHPSEKTFPAKSIVFSTLTPCEQCTNYLTDSRPLPDSLIFFGQKDTGPSGKAGERIGSALSEKTKALRGQQYEIENNLLLLGGETTASGIIKIAIDNGLGTCHSEDSMVAAKIGKNENSASILMSSLQALSQKSDKKRDGKNPEESDENVIKEKVLRYLVSWVNGIINQ